MFQINTEELFGDFKSIFKDVNTIFNTALNPYNIYKSDGEAVLEIPLAGYSKDELRVTLEGDVLNIKHPGKGDKPKGLIAYSIKPVDIKFKITGWEIKDSKYLDGLLTVSFKNKEQEKNGVKEIKVD